MRGLCDSLRVGYDYFMLRTGESPEAFWERLDAETAGGEPIPDQESFSASNRRMAEIGKVMVKWLPSDDQLLLEFHYGPPDRIRAEVSARVGDRLRVFLELNSGAIHGDRATRSALDPGLVEPLWEFARLCERAGKANGLIVG